MHQGSVRAISALPNGMLLSGSIDKTLKLFNLSNSGRYEFDKELSYHDNFVYSICPQVSGSGWFTGGKDNKIMMIDAEGNPMQELLGHEGAVNSLCQVNGTELISGSWDGTAKIWDIETGKAKQTLEGHSYATSVLGLPNGVIITGSQDKKIRLWF